MEKPIKRGRPIVGSPDRQKATTGFRPSPGLKRALVAAAQHNGASLSEEIVDRLQLSLIYETIFGNRELLKLASRTFGAFVRAGREAAIEMQRRELLEDEAWLRDPVCYDEGVAGGVVELAVSRPGGLTERAADRYAAGLLLLSKQYAGDRA